MFTNDIVLVDEIRDRVNGKVERWRQTLESQGFRLRVAFRKYYFWWGRRDVCVEMGL